MKTSSSKIALVSGANKGIGHEVARQLAASGCTVLLGTRNRVLGHKAVSRLTAEGHDVRNIEIDLDDPATIAAAANNILVNNAGTLADNDGPASASSSEAIERALRVNFIGAVAVTQAMLAPLRKSSSARIVNVSSALGSLTQNGDPAWPGAHKYLGYAASKAALNMLTIQLAYELRGARIKVNSACPGYTATYLNQHEGTQTSMKGCGDHSLGTAG